MNEIILSAEQASIVASAEESVVIRGPDGDIVGWLRLTANYKTPSECPFTPEEVAAAERELDSPGPWRTTKEVLERLRSLTPTSLPANETNSPRSHSRP